MPKKILQKQKISSLLYNSNINNSKSNYGDALFVNRKNQNASLLLVGKLKDKDSDGYADINDCDKYNPNQHGIFKTVVTAVKKVIGRETTPTTTTSTKVGTYEASSGTYTSPTGEKQSMATAPTGSISIGGTSYTGGSTTTTTPSGGGYSYVDTTTGKGYEVSPTGIKTEVTPTTITKTYQRSLIPQSLQQKTQTPTYNPATQTYTSSTGQKQSMGNIHAVPKNTAIITSTGKVDKSFDKFGRPIEFYNYIQQDVAKRTTQKEYDSSVEKAVNQQIKLYQQLVNENKISADEANKQLNKVINVYAKDLSETMNVKLQNKLSSIQSGYETERVKKGVKLVEEQQYGTQSFKDSRAGSSFGIGSNNIVSASNGFVTGSSVRMDGGSQYRDTTGGVFSRFANSFKKDFQKETTETYSSTLGAFISASPTGQGSTGFIRQPTQEEKYKIEQAQYKGDLYGGAIKSVPASMLSIGLSQIATGGVTKEDLTTLYPESKVGTIFSLVDPKKHYEVFKSKFDYEQAVKKANIVVDKLNEIDEQYAEGKIDYGEYETKFNYYSKNKDYQRVLSEQEQRGSLHGFIDKSGMERKNLAHFAVGAIDFGTFFVPATRVARGGEYLLTGTEALGQAQTRQEMVSAGVQIGVGGLLMGSGFGGGTSMFGGLKGTGGKAIQSLAKVETRMGISEGGIGQRLIKFGESRTGRITGKAVSEVPGVGISGLYGYGVYKETEDIGAGVSAGLGAYAGIKIPGGVSKFVKGKPLTQSEAVKLENELKQLEKSEALDVQVVAIGKGKMINSDRVKIVVTQETPNFKRLSTIEGDVIRNEKGQFIFPEGKGITVTEGKFSVPKKFGDRTFRGEQKLYSNVQSFEVGAKGKGILLRQVGDLQISTQVGSSTYIPKSSVTQIFKEPKNWYQYAKESLRLKLGKPTIKRGGQIVKSYETDLTPRTLSLRKDMEVSENILLKSFGVSVSRGRKGTFFEFAEKPKLEVNVIKTQLEPSRKTPFSKTFEGIEPVSKPVDLISPKISQIQLKTQPIKAEQIKDFGLISKRVSREVGKVSKGELAELTRVKVTPKFSSFLFGGEISREKQREKQREELKGKEKVIPRERLGISDLISPRIKEGIKETQIFITPQITTPGLIQEITKQTPTIQNFIFSGEIKPPTPKPPRPIIPFGFRREKTKSTKEQPYDVMVRRDATKLNKARWEQINRQPLTRESALSMGSRDVDETISARYKITKAKEIIQQVRDNVGGWVDKKIKPKAVDTGDDYYKTNQNKFRTFRQKKGKKIAMPMTYIELQKYRADKRGERTALKVGREDSVRGFFGI